MRAGRSFGGHARQVLIAGFVASVAALWAPQAARAADFVEPAVFASAGGVLDILMIARPMPVQAISFPPIDGSPPVTPEGWLYEICPRPQSGTTCPMGGSTIAEYGGVRLALQQGDTLKIRLVNRLPAINPLKAKHSGEPGQANLPLNPTNLHTHGLIVPARQPTLNDPTFGDYVFVDIFNSDNGMPEPQAEHQHGQVKMDFADYRIEIPADHPSGTFWFHPHVHGLTLNQLTSGMSGIITIGSPGDYIANPPSTVRHLILKDMQILPAGSFDVGAGKVDFFEGEIQRQESGDFCEQNGYKGPPANRQGFCEGEPPERDGVESYVGGRWYFPLSGTVFPTIHMTSADGELWRLTNSSPQVTYKLSLTDPVTRAPMAMQLVALDGVSVVVPAGTANGDVVAQGGNRFTIASCPPVGGTLPVCVSSITMMPSSRAELFVTYRDASGNAVSPPPGATVYLHQNSQDLGPAGEIWPALELARISFEQPGAQTVALAVNGKARSMTPRAKAAAPATNLASATPGANCQPLAAGHRRRIFFGFEDPFDPDSNFGLGYEEVDQMGNPVAGTQVPVTAFDPAVTRVCIPLGPNGAPVTEDWELISLATEIHNFHIHQTKFTVLETDGLRNSLAAGTAPPISSLIEDNVPVPYADANIDAVNDDQNGYCTIEQWRSGDCTAHRVVVRIPFSQLGDFTYHCHIVEHGDSGMMAKIRVVSTPSTVTTAATHDFNGDGRSDLAWRHANGGPAMWLMDNDTIIGSGAFGPVPQNYRLFGQRDFNGDGKTDWLWRGDDGTVVLWYLSGLQAQGSTSVGVVAPAWTIVGTGDFNGDGKGDIVWRDTQGNVAIWLMNGARVTSSALFSPGAGWSVASVGDFNGDGKSDIVWRDTGGYLAIWLMDGVAMTSTAILGPVTLAWSIVGTGDFNGDNRSDILWRDTQGNVAMWFMDGTAVLGSTVIGTISTAWSVAETGDFDGDGRSDIVWRDTSYNTAIWYMRGADLLRSSVLGNVGPDWTLQTINAN